MMIGAFGKARLISSTSDSLIGADPVRRRLPLPVARHADAVGPAREPRRAKHHCRFARVRPHLREWPGIDKPRMAIRTRRIEIDHGQAAWQQRAAGAVAKRKSHL